MPFEAETHQAPSWADTLPKTDHVRLFKDTDWSQTALGPLQGWPQSLRQMVGFLMADSRISTLIWGSQHVLIYNDPYNIVLGGRKVMGSRLHEAWDPGVSDAIEKTMQDAEEKGYSLLVQDAPFFINRIGPLEETYFNYNTVPIRGESGEIEGFLLSAEETSRKVIADRRTKTLLSLETLSDISSFWDSALHILESNALDIPLAAVYSCRTRASVTQLGDDFKLVAGLGLTNHAVTAHSTIHEDFGSKLLPIVKQALPIADDIVIFLVDNSSLPAETFDGIDWRGFREAFTTLVVMKFAAGHEPFALFLALNPRKALDDDCKQFLQLLYNQLSTSLTSAELLQKANARQLLLSQQVAEGENRFKTLTELSPVGMFCVSPQGEVLYGNDTYYEMIEYPKIHHKELHFEDTILEEDVSLIQAEWLKIKQSREKSLIEVRLNKKWYHGSSNKWKNVWVLAGTKPEENEDGSLKSIMGCITDISLQKQAQEDAVEKATLLEQLNALTERSRKDAEEARNAQEKFMDITSHEIRNPLSAILQSADGIASSMLDLQASKIRHMPEDLIESTIEAAQTIIMCAQHQARIINDVLTLSKLDSAIVQITPVKVRPEAVVRAALNMFTGELSANEISLEFHLEESYREHRIDWILLDPSRLTQIFVNLMTNAIKFTKSQPKRHIHVMIGASVDKPPKLEINVHWFPSRTSEAGKDLTLDSEWGKGQALYISFSVRDTGRGLADEEKSRLFRRFAQANVRTHVEYGGSGLGLFISRELTELQGGEIGLASVAGNGSKFYLPFLSFAGVMIHGCSLTEQGTFTFFVKGRRASTPPTESEKRNDGVPEKLLQDPLEVQEPPRSTYAPTVNEVFSKGGERRPGVLLVEDNLVNQRVLSKQLKKAGCIVAVANHGQEALDYLTTTTMWLGNKGGTQLHVVLMDLEMPVMGGLSCTRRIRELEREGIVRHVPIIAVTANARKELIETCLQAGMDDVMPKPFRVAELTVKIDKLLSSAS